MTPLQSNSLGARKSPRQPPLLETQWMHDLYCSAIGKIVPLDPVQGGKSSFFGVASFWRPLRLAVSEACALSEYTFEHHGTMVCCAPIPGDGCRDASEWTNLRFLVPHLDMSPVHRSRGLSLRWPNVCILCACMIVHLPDEQANFRSVIRAIFVRSGTCIAAIGFMADNIAFVNEEFAISVGP